MRIRFGKYSLVFICIIFVISKAAVADVVLLTSEDERLLAELSPMIGQKSLNSAQKEKIQLAMQSLNDEICLKGIEVLLLNRIKLLWSRIEAKPKKGKCHLASDLVDEIVNKHNFRSDALVNVIGDSYLNDNLPLASDPPPRIQFGDIPLYFYLFDVLVKNVIVLGLRDDQQILDKFRHYRVPDIFGKKLNL